jgi:predicted lipoprotein
MLTDLGRVVIVPTYDQLVGRADELITAAAALEDIPNASTLAATQQAWRRARTVWKQSAAFAFGPAASLDTAAKIDWKAIRPARIETELAGTAELTPEYVEQLGVNVKGFLALEYLIFDPSGDDTAVIEQLSASPRRRRYVVALTENLREEARRLRDAWAPGGGNFAAQLSSAGQGSTAYATLKSAVDAVVNQLIFVSTDVADAQLLAALGGRDRGAPDPEALPAHRSENGLADVVDGLTGIENVYLNAYASRHGVSLADIVASLSGTVPNVLAAAIHRAIDSAARIPPPLESAIVTDTAAVELAQVRSTELRARLEVDLVSVLGTTLRFNPSDGD